MQLFTRNFLYCMVGGVSNYCIKGLSCIYRRIDDKSWFSGCGKCKEGELCYQCDTNNCNTHRAYEKALFCFNSEEKEVGPRYCEKETCFISADFVKSILL
ncbi:unnamed protein product [Meloidogyne enterolobii]|uniref:Uncharacterized protein n=1 Tax=Meloidogyne enterolobii TaxID=390850 RepID=A0ACB0ZRA3_MELEN